MVRLLCLSKSAVWGVIKSGQEMQSCRALSTNYGQFFNVPKFFLSNGGSKHSRKISFDRLTKSVPEKAWRESGSLIIVAPMNNSPPYSLGYLMVERSKGGGVSPGGCVFPGGIIAPIDSSPKWLDVYKNIDVDLTTQEYLVKGATVPGIYNNQEDKSPLPFPKSVMLRLTTIRETFEEVGILICRRSCGSSNPAGGHMYEYEQLMDRKVVQAWQTKIRKNSEEFFNLCTELNCVPDLSALWEWSNWLTPTIIKPKARFDTMFYMIVLPSMLRVAYDTHEVASAQWASAQSLLKEHAEGKVKLMLPQLFELTRLKDLKALSDFEVRMKFRREKGIERFFPVVQQAKDGTVFLLPGDDFYPTTPDTLTPSKSLKVDQTLLQLRDSAKNLNRGEITKANVYQTAINIAKHGHIY